MINKIFAIAECLICLLINGINIIHESIIRETVMELERSFMLRRLDIVISISRSQLKIMARNMEDAESRTKGNLRRDHPLLN